MKWSWKIARVGGVDVRVHATFVLLLAWVALAHYELGGTAGAAGAGVLFILALFASVVLHELGHAMMARHFGVRTRDITLLPIGGVARLERMPEKPREELLVALAGPAVTFAIAGTLYAALRLAGAPTTAPEAAGGVVDGASSFAARLMWVNVSLLLFNLLPAFPMDGGRVLRAALAMRGDYVRATETAARVGRAFALVFGVIGLFYNPLLVVIALFVWLGAASEAAAAQMRWSLGGVPVERVMIRDVRTLSPADTLGTALDALLGGFQQDFPVVRDGALVGVLTTAALLKALAQHGRETLVEDSMDRAFRTSEPDEPVERALERLREGRCRTLPVVSGGRLQGVLTLDNVGEFVMAQSALRGSAA